MENLLYYPYINIPKSDWLSRALLYYDQIGSIIPYNFYHNPDNLDPHMRKLLQDELVIPVDPMVVVKDPSSIARPFINYLNNDVKINKRRERFQNGQTYLLHRNKFSLQKRQLSNQNARIHVNKFDYEIFYHLEHAGLAIRSDNDWFLVENKTADDLMNFLASVLAAKLEFRPATDKLKRTESFSIPNKQGKRLRSQNETRQLILNELIPFPEQIDLSKIRKFKDNHFELLRDFKNTIEDIVLDPNMEVGSQRLNNKIEGLRIRKNELSAKMEESSFGKIFYGTLCGTIGAAIGLTTAETTLAAAGGLLGLGNAVYSALTMEKAEDKFDQSGLKYLSLIDKKLRVR